MAPPVILLVELKNTRRILVLSLVLSPTTLVSTAWFFYPKFHRPVLHVAGFKTILRRGCGEHQQGRNLTGEHFKRQWYCR